LDKLAGITVAEVGIEASNDVDYSDGMSEQDAIRFRKQAEEARQHAERAISLLDKEAWLRVAGEWIKLAEEVEKRGDRR
jgi:hypothetical protein